MLKARQILLVVFAGVFAIAPTAIAFGAHTSSENRNGTTSSAELSHEHTRSVPRRHHRRSSSVRRSKRLPKAKSLEKESW